MLRKEDELIFGDILLRGTDIATALMKRATTKRIERDEDLKKSEPLFYARSPENIKFSKRGEKKYEEIPRDTFAKTHGFAWSDSMFSSPEVRDMLWEDKTHPKTALPKLEERLHNPLDCLNVFEKELPELGLGVRLAYDAEPLPAGTIIAPMAGELISTIPYHKISYVVPLTEDEQKDSIITDKISHPNVVSDRVRNVGGLINDAPQLDELAKTKVKASNAYAKCHVGSANAVIVPYLHKGCAINFIMLARKLMPGEEIFWSFGDGFWSQNEGKRYAFDPEGNVIGYYNKPDEITLSPGEKKADRKPAPQIDLNELYRLYTEVGANPKVIIPPDTFDAARRFVFDVRYSLGVFAKRYGEDSPEGLYIKKVQDKFEEDKHVPVRFNNLHHFVFVDKSFAKLLPKLKSELEIHIKKYQTTKPKPMLGQKAQDKTKPATAAPAKKVKYGA